MHFPPVVKKKTKLSSLTERREKGKSISSSQMKFLTFSLVKIKDVKENTYIKNLIFSWNCCWVFLGLFTSFYHSFWGKEREEMSVIHDSDSTSYTINFILFLQFLIHKAALWHHSCALVWKRKEKAADTACSLPMAAGVTCFPITEAEQKIELKW